MDKFSEMYSSLGYLATLFVFRLYSVVKVDGRRMNVNRPMEHFLMITDRGNPKYSKWGNAIPNFHNKLHITYRGIELEALPEICQSPVRLNSTVVSLKLMRF